MSQRPPLFHICCPDLTHRTHPLLGCLITLHISVSDFRVCPQANRAASDIRPGHAIGGALFGVIYYWVGGDFFDWLRGARRADTLP